jgi:predicted RNase H-like HicB family nuclease
MAEYLALLRKDESTDYCVDFPDFPGCITTGETLEEARKNAAASLSLHLEGMVEDGVEIPEPSALDVVMHDSENRDAVAFLVSIETPEPRVERVNVTFARDVLARIDEFAKERKLSRSAFLAKAALAQMKPRRSA